MTSLFLLISILALAVILKIIYDKYYEPKNKFGVYIILGGFILMWLLIVAGVIFKMNSPILNYLLFADGTIVLVAYFGIALDGIIWGYFNGFFTSLILITAVFHPEFLKKYFTIVITVLIILWVITFIPLVLEGLKKQKISKHEEV